MISVNRLSVQFGGSDLFDDVSFLVNSRDRIGLTGKNGAGKSTMLKILAGEQKPSEGEIAIQNDCTLGYLPQEMKHNVGKTVFEAYRREAEAATSVPRTELKENWKMSHPTKVNPPFSLDLTFLPEGCSWICFL